MSGSSTETAAPRAGAAAYQPLVIVLVAACGGIVADRLWPLPVGAWWGGGGVALAAWAALWRRRRDPAASIVLLLAVAAAAASWHHCRWSLFGRDNLGFYARAEGQPVCVEGVAVQSPRLLPAPEFDPMRSIPVEQRSRLELDLSSVRDGAAWRAVSGRTRLEVYGDPPEVASGDRLRVFGQLSLPRSAKNPGEFDFAEYMRGDRLLCELDARYPECVSVVEPGGGWGPRRLIELARSHSDRLLREYLAPKRSALAGAVLLGAREGLDPEQTQAFVETGTVHLLAISGFHLGILAGGLLFVMLKLPIRRGWAMLCVAGLTVCYMLLTDARPPVVRATILVLVVCGALYLHRRPLSFNSLAAAGLVVLAISPADLFHTGAQLSFLAVAGLMWFGPRWILLTPERDPLARIIRQSHKWPARMLWAIGQTLRHLTLASATIWLLTMPLVTARFHLLTPAAVVLNTLLWVPMALALISGFAALVLGTLAGPLGQLFGGLCDANLWLLATSVDFARDLPGSHFWVCGPPDWWLAGFYGGLGLLAAFPRIRPSGRWCLAMLAAWSLLGVAPRWLAPQPDRLECTFLSVGHGCAVVLELPSGQTLLYDAGQFGSPVSGVRSISGLLWSRGIRRLDGVIISHADIDHYNALPGLLERFSVRAIYVSPAMWQGQGAALEALADAIRHSGVPLRQVRAGELLPVGKDCRIKVLNPPGEGLAGEDVSDNANSIVLAVEYLGHRVLLPGDLESPGLDGLLTGEPTDCDVLLVPHHGSQQSNAPGLAAWSTPQWVVISGSHRWDTRPVQAAYRAAGSQVFHTADSGAVSVRIDARGVRVGMYVPPGG